MAGPGNVKSCRNSDCDERIFLAYRVDRRAWRSFEALDRPAFTEQSAGSFVIVGDQAWRPQDLIEHFQAYHELSEPDARARVADYPFHRLHIHPPTEGAPQQ